MLVSSRISAHSAPESSASALIALHKRTISKLSVESADNKSILLKTPQIHTFYDQNAFVRRENVGVRHTNRILKREIKTKSLKLFLKLKI